MAVLTTQVSMEHTYQVHLERALRDIEYQKALLKQLDNGCDHNFIPEREHTSTKHYHRQVDRSTSVRRGLFSASYSSTPIYMNTSSEADKEIRAVLCNHCLLSLSESDYARVSGVTNRKKEDRRLNANRKDLELLLRVLHHPRFIEMVKEKHAVAVMPDYSIGHMVELAKKFVSLLQDRRAEA